MAGTSTVTRLPEGAAGSAPPAPATVAAEATTRRGLRRWIPSALHITADDASLVSGRIERTRKDWVLDSVAFLLSIGLGVLFHLEALGSDPRPSGLLVAIDVAILPIGAVLLFFRRRWPLGVALASAVMAALGPSVACASLIVAFSVACWSRPPLGLYGIAALVSSVPIYAVLWPDANDTGDVQTGMLTNVIFGVLATVGAGAWGLFAGARRQLMASLEERAVRAESEQALRVGQARAQERTRIAREMHDVLAHRMSLLSVHAGALEFRPDAPPEEIARAAGVIRATAHDALEELRAVIGVMRVADSLVGGPGVGSGTDGAAVAARADVLGPEPPQPTLRAVPHLVEEWTQAGARIDLHLDQAAVDGLPATVGRTAYRIVQEALTNAGKHAPTARVEVHVDGAAGESLTVSVANPLRLGSQAAPPVDPIPGTGLGLVGLRERTELIGGVFAAGIDEDLQRFVLEARLPWPAA